MEWDTHSSSYIESKKRKTMPGKDIPKYDTQTIKLNYTWKRKKKKEVAWKRKAEELKHNTNDDEEEAVAANDDQT